MNRKGKRMNHRKIVTIMKSKSGISLVFVLAVTLLLLAIGASTLVAATTAAGSSQSQVAYRQMELYTDSLVKTLTYQLKLKPSDGFERTLSGKLLLAMYQHEKQSDPEKKPLTQTLAVKLNSGSSVNTNITVSDFKLNFDPLDVEITPAVEGEEAVTGTNTDGSSVMILPGTERQPEIARVNATVKVTIELENGESNMSSVATYEYTDGYLEDGNIKSVLGLGNWRLTGYERVDQIS